MEEFNYLVKEENGLHARPAGLLVQCAKTCSSNVLIIKGTKVANAKHLFAIMGLDVGNNDKITFQVDGPEAKLDCAKLKEFCKANI